MSLWILFRLVRPLDRFEAVLIGLLLTVLVVGGGIVVLQIVFGLGDRLVRRHRSR